MPEQRMTYETSRAIRDAVVALSFLPAVPEPERRALAGFLGRRPDADQLEPLRAAIRRHRGLLLPELVTTALGGAPDPAEVVPEVQAPPAAEAPPPEQAPRKRGRPPSGKALTGAERARRWRQRHEVADVQVPRPLAARIRDMADARGLSAAELLEAALDRVDGA